MIVLSSTLLAFLLFELALLFVGVTIFTEQVNIVNIVLHILGNIASLWFVVDTWQSGLLVFIWVLFG